MAPVSPLVILALTVAAATAAGAPQKRLFVLLDFEDGYSTQSVATMQREVERVFQSVPIQFVWMSHRQAIAGVSGSMAVIRFRGSCLFQAGLPAPPRATELAVTEVSDGEVLPFSNVACNQIAAFVEPAIRALDRTRADMLFGRAMGRVVAHEIAHILSRSTAHGTEGVTERALSVYQLTCDILPLGWSHSMGQGRHIEEPSSTSDRP